jgi:very-short-patch-repair endonuclease
MIGSQINLDREFEQLAARAHAVDAILRAQTPVARRAAIRAFYVQAWKDIKQRPACVWTIDPYEAQLDAYMTPIERELWCDLRAEAIVMYPQHPVGRFFVDFGNPVARVAIECDGAAFHADKAKDAARQREIEAFGWAVYRFTGSECMQDFVDAEDEETGEPIVSVSHTRQRLREIARLHGLSVKHGGKWA